MSNAQPLQNHSKAKLGKRIANIFASTKWLSRFLLWYRVTVGLGPLVISIAILVSTEWFLPDGWAFALLIFGIGILFHISVDRFLRLAVKRASVDLDIRVENATPVSKVVFDTFRQLANWMIVASGVVIGLAIRADVNTLVAGSAIALGAVVVVAFIYISVIVGGVHNECDTQVEVGSINYWLSQFLLNTMFMLFIFGIAGLAVSIIPAVN